MVETMDDVPRREPLEALEKVAAKFAHLGEEKRRRETEQRAREDIADLYVG